MTFYSYAMVSLSAALVLLFLPVPAMAAASAPLTAPMAMLSLLPAWLLALALASLRVSMVFALTPLLRMFAMPTLVRLLLVLALSIGLAASLLPSMGTVTLAPQAGTLIRAALVELAMGATLALGVLLAFGAFSLAGNLLDVQIGFGIAQVFDPSTQRQVPILASLFNQLAVLMFFVLNGHHALLRTLSASFEFFPPGLAWSPTLTATAVMGHAASLFALAFSLAVPVMASLLLVDMALGIVARTLPQMNLFAIGIPVKILAGLLALAAWFQGAGAIMNRIYAGIHAGWKQLFGLAGGVALVVMMACVTCAAGVRSVASKADVGGVAGGAGVASIDMVLMTGLARPAAPADLVSRTEITLSTQTVAGIT